MEPEAARAGVPAGPTAAPGPPATHQDALEEVALLGRQLHGRHRGRRGGCGAARSVPRRWAPGQAAAETQVRATGQFIDPDLGLGVLGRAVDGQGARSRSDALSSGPASERAAAAPALQDGSQGPPLERAVCAGARRRAAWGGAGRGAGRRAARGGDPGARGPWEIPGGPGQRQLSSRPNLGSGGAHALWPLISR